MGYVRTIQQKDCGKLEGFARLVRGALIFGIVGPLVGYFTFLITVHLFHSDARLIDVFHPLTVIGLFLAYWFAGVPAMAVGALAGLLHPWLIRWRDCFAIGAIGGLFPFGLAMALSDRLNWGQVTTLLVPGLFGGTASAWVLSMGQRRLGSNLPRLH